MFRMYLDIKAMYMAWFELLETRVERHSSKWISYSQIIDQIF
jgi:hypothetical protein